MVRGEIKQNGKRKPCHFNSNGIDCDFIYDPNHPLVTQYPFSPKILLLVYMSEKLKARDALPDIVSVISALAISTMGDEKLDSQILAERSSSVFEKMREKLAQALRPRAEEVIRCIHESAGEVEETVANILPVNSTLLIPFQNSLETAFDAIEFVPQKTLYRLVERFPEDVFDGKVFSTPYKNIHLTDENATKRMREVAKDRILSFIKDVLHIVSNSGQRVQKAELMRASLSVDFLSKELES